MAKLLSKWATQSLLPKEFATCVKKQFTGEKIENRQVKKSFHIGTKENCALRRKADFSANIHTHRQTRNEVMKERPVADRGDKIFLNACRFSSKMTLKPYQSSWKSWKRK